MDAIYGVIINVILKNDGANAFTATLVILGFLVFMYKGILTKIKNMGHEIHTEQNNYKHKFASHDKLNEDVCDDVKGIKTEISKISGMLSVLGLQSGRGIK